VPAVEATDPERVGNAVIWAYSAPRIAIGFLGLLFGVYLMKFSTDVLLIAPAAMGTLLVISRVWDAVSDPMAGYLSDRTRARAGRRRSWMYAAAVPMGLTLVMLWSPPSFEGLALVVWMGFALLAYETASTAFFVPHGALGVELTQDHHERTRLFGLSHIIGFLGTILGLGAYWLLDNAEDKREMAFHLSLVGGLGVAAVILASTRVLPERAEYQGRGSERILHSFRDVGRNPHARLLLIVYGIETFGAASIGLLVPYVTEYLLGDKSLTIPIILTYFLPQVAFAPLWIRLSRRFGKKRLWLTAMLTTSFGFAGLFWIEPGDYLLLFGLPLLLGTAGGVGAVIAPSIQADVIDYDEYVSAERKEGTYLAIWNFIRKAAGGVTMFVTGGVMQLMGYEPNVAQSAEAELGIRSLFSFLPAGCYLIGSLLFVRFSLNEHEHRHIRTALDARALGKPEPEPPLTLR
jgi:GPH family glycoside/pentoside/hexuronide:cation symporter